MWTRACGMIDLSEQSGARGNTSAIDDGGRIVGWADFGAFVWTASEGMRPLGIEAATISSTGGWLGGTGPGPDWDAALWRYSVVDPNRSPVGAPPALSVPEGSTAVAVEASGFTDPDGDVICYEWQIDGVYTRGPTATVSLDEDGAIPYTLSATDLQGASTSVSGTITVYNVAPTARFSVTPEVDEGSPIRLALADARDPSAADQAAGFQYAFDCGMGSGFSPFGPDAVHSCPTIDDQATPLTVRALIRDRDGGTTLYEASAIIRNVAPLPRIRWLPDTVEVDRWLTGVGDFTDPGVQDGPWTVTVIWDLDRGALTQTRQVTAQGCAELKQRYTAVGMYQVQVRVTDKDSGTGYSGIDTVHVVARHRKENVLSCTTAP